MNPLTFPARPINGGHLKHALPKRGEWTYEPKYNGWRALVHCPTGQMWNRHGQPLSIAAEFHAALDLLRAIHRRFPEFLWADTESLERRHNLGRGSLIILDFPHAQALDTAPYEQRRQWLHDNIITRGYGQILPPESTPEPGLIYLAPGYGQTDLAELWARLQAVNRQLSVEFYEGVVAKRSRSYYPVQLHNPNHETPDWIKHRFVN